jgi:hypothetical protein
MRIFLIIKLRRRPQLLSLIWTVWRILPPEIKTDGLFVLPHVDLYLLLVDLVKSEATPTVSGVAHLLHLYFFKFLRVVAHNLMRVLLGFPH